MKYKLSICIPTLNRGNYIGETLESIVSQWDAKAELVIVDGGSSDNTEEVVNSYQQLFEGIRYIKSASSDTTPSNEGFDRDCNHAVELAAGDYCWLMTDDDLLKPGAMTRVLSELENNYSVIVANVEIRNSDLTELLLDRRLNISEDRIFEPSEWSDFVISTANHLTYVGAVVIKRELWLNRKREKYYGSGFLHVGVIFEELIRGRILATSDPLVAIRFGNAHWASRAFEIWMINWPRLIWSFSSISDATKSSICPQEPWRSLARLLYNRALGVYSMREYGRFIHGEIASGYTRLVFRVIAKLPRAILYVAALMYKRLRRPDDRFGMFNLKDSWIRKC